MFENSALLYICTSLEAIEKIEIYARGFEGGEDLREANDQMKKQLPNRGCTDV